MFSQYRRSSNSPRHLHTIAAPLCAERSLGFVGLKVLGFRIVCVQCVAAQARISGPAVGVHCATHP